MKLRESKLLMDGHAALVSEVLELENRIKPQSKDSVNIEAPTLPVSLSDGEEDIALRKLRKEKGYNSDMEVNLSKKLETKAVRTSQRVVLVLSEPFMDESQLQRVAYSLGFDNFCSNEAMGGKIWVIWNHQYEFDMVDMSDQMVIGWLLAGDFNIIREDGERIGGQPRPLSAMGEFNDCLDNCGLVEMRAHGRRMSWCNGRSGQAMMWAKLDRVMVNSVLLNEHNFCEMEFLSRKSSDHCPMLIHFSKAFLRYGPSPFRFQNMWSMHDTFNQMVMWQSGFDPNLEAEFLDTKAELQLWEKREETRLAQKAKKKWLVEGDQNSKFFHAVVNQRRKSSHISSMRLSDGIVLASPEEVHNGAVKYFEQTLRENGTSEQGDLASILSAVVSAEDNDLLCVEPTEEEVKDAFFSIPTESSP
ncbi:uncharacterized protein LOC111375558 [Olea europaea var. sylvestris]|uniref:uncharacterized protein LOC111375558 n=1 Tax=Olea europaea var. sylvestris TaxID=158386 RepID=UPI000C1D193A|nr:uncharacterized protein LOC111375558 [Olea europaea var. sylvestris]